MRWKNLSEQWNQKFLKSNKFNKTFRTISILDLTCLIYAILARNDDQSRFFPETTFAKPIRVDLVRYFVSVCSKLADSCVRSSMRKASVLTMKGIQMNTGYTMTRLIQWKSESITRWRIKIDVKSRALSRKPSVPIYPSPFSLQQCFTLIGNFVWVFFCIRSIVNNHNLAQCLSF